MAEQYYFQQQFQIPNSYLIRIIKLLKHVLYTKMARKSKSILECNAIWSGRELSMFRRTLLYPSLGLGKMKKQTSFQTSVEPCQMTRRHLQRNGILRCKI